MKQFKVFYHKNCNDGIFAAILIGKSLAKYDKFPIVYEAIQYGDEVNYTTDDYVVFVDFCPSKEVILDLCDKEIKTMIIDHHKTAYDLIKDLDIANKPNLIYYIHIGESAAKICKRLPLTHIESIVDGYDDGVTLTNATFNDHFNDGKGIEYNKHITEFVELLHIRDCWVTEDAELKYRADCLSTCLFDRGIMYDLDRAEQLFRYIYTHGVDFYVKEGKVILDYILKESIGLVKGGLHLDIKSKDGIDVKVCFISTHMNISQAGAYWVDQHAGPAVLVAFNFVLDKGMVLCGIRSNAFFPSNTLGEMMALKGMADTGGGHHQAAGMKIQSREVDPQSIIDEVNRTISEINLKGE